MRIKSLYRKLMFFTCAELMSDQEIRTLGNHNIVDNESDNFSGTN